MKLVIISGLNPFEFRAGLEQANAVAAERLTVLIPLNSGLAWSGTRQRLDARDARLNPFEFRAGLERAGSAYMKVKALS